MLTAGQLKLLIKDLPDDYTPMIRVITDPGYGGEPEFWTTSLLAEDVTEEPLTHELRFTITDYQEDW